jgi:diguanylate cyclase (GGDEF)-like protein
MITFSNFYTDIYAIIILVLVLLIVIDRKDFFTVRQNLFIIMLIGDILLLSNEVWLSYLSGKTGSTIESTLSILNYLRIILTIIEAVIWMNYISFSIFHSFKRLKKIRYFFHYVLIGFSLLIINIFYPIVFYIDQNNIYQRLWGIYIIMALIFLQVFIFVGELIVHKNVIVKRDLLGIVLMLFFPLVGGIIQIISTEFLSLYSMFGISIIVGYMMLENITSNTDELTKLFTRKKVYQLIDNLILREMDFTIILFDLDNLKLNNDLHGHETGDKMLICFSKQLKSVFGVSSVISRLGGDEFLVISYETNKQAINDLLVKFRSNLNCNIPTEILFSYGSVFSNELEVLDVNSIIRLADERMYDYKVNNKHLRRRKSDLEA